MSRRLIAVLVACLVLAACGDDPSPTTAVPHPSRPRRRHPASRRARRPNPGTEIVVADSKFGPMLFDKRKQAIYLFDIEDGQAGVLRRLR